MRYHFALVALLLPLSGCDVPPDQAGYGYGYPQPGYGAGYAQPDYGYPGFSYYDGSPALAVGGSTVPLIFYGGGWGYWDGGHNWHHAPEGVARNLDRRFPGGSGYHAWGGSPATHLGGPSWGEGWQGHPGGLPPGGGWQGHAGGPTPGGGWEGHPPGLPPGGGFAGRPLGGGAPPGGAPRLPGPPPGSPAAAHSPIAAAVSRIAPPPGAHQREEHR
jgi:hypothetical protein